MRIFQVDAFTHTRFTGNPATVVLDADGQSDASMTAIAREFQSEVAFVSAATAPDHDFRLRFFNTRKESAFVGHATVAAHAVLIAEGRRGEGICRQLSGTGIIEVRAHIGPGTTVEFRQTSPQLDQPLPLKTSLRIAEALALPGALLHDSMPARIARKGSTRLLVPVAAPGALPGLAPNYATLVELGAELGTDGFFVFAVSADDTGMTTESRMFCPALGIAEDPVSGNAHAMLAAYLWDLGRLRGPTAAFVGRQGMWMNRPGRVDVRLEIDHDRLLAAHIGGTAVIVSEGRLL